jgi:hypothetical protein
VYCWVQLCCSCVPILVAVLVAVLDKLDLLLADNREKLFLNISTLSSRIGILDFSGTSEWSLLIVGLLPFLEIRLQNFINVLQFCLKFDLVHSWVNFGTPKFELYYKL